MTLLRSGHFDDVTLHSHIVAQYPRILSTGLDLAENKKRNVALRGARERFAHLPHKLQVKILNYPNPYPQSLEQMCKPILSSAQYDISFSFLPDRVQWIICVDIEQQYDCIG
jgi:hypothetical protein